MMKKSVKEKEIIEAIEEENTEAIEEENIVAIEEENDESPPILQKKNNYADVAKAPAKTTEPSKPKKKSVTWFGTSISNVLDKKKFEDDMRIELTLQLQQCF